MTAYVPPYSPSLLDWQRQLATTLNAFFQRLVIDYTTTPFTNSAYYSNAQLSMNGATPGAWYNAQFSGNNATEALTAAALVPSTATNIQTSALAAYVQSDRAQPTNGGDVAGFFDATAAANNSAVFPINTVANDTAGKTGQILTTELDYNVNAADTLVNGINLVIVGNTTLTGNRNAITVQGVFHPTSTWSNGLITGDGCIDLYAAFIGSQTSTTSTNRESQKIGFVSYTSGNTRYIGSIRGDHGGGLQFQPGAATGTFGFLDNTGANFWAYISSNGISIPEIASASVVSPMTGFQTLFIDTADHKLKRKDSGGTVTIIA